MARVWLIHWHEQEVAERRRALEDAGHQVMVHWRQGSRPERPDPLPDVMVVSLDRLPSHGRAIAEWLWEAKSRRHIPIVFAGGSPDKVAATRKRFPDATFCTTADMVATVATASGGA
ncbi:MAG: hypothetical protein D6683_05075 [Actinomyces sp.]|nr:MAG: hypothetical protein D6683_05075 [Actinomyces sp.]